MLPTPVTNQVPPLKDYDAADYAPLLEALERAGAGDSLDEVHDVGRLAGSAASLALGDLAEAHPPVLRTHDRFGTGSTRSSTTPPITSSCAPRFPSACTVRPGTTRDPTRT